MSLRTAEAARPRKGVFMQQFLTTLTPFAVLAVAVVLVLGLGNLLRTDSANTSQTLMRWRVGLQFAAICILMLVLYLRKS